MRFSSIIPFVLAAPAVLGAAVFPREDGGAGATATVTSTAITTVTHSPLPSGTGSLKLVYENGTTPAHVSADYEESEAEKNLDKRKKKPKVTVSIERGGGFKGGDKDKAIDEAEDVLEDYDYKSGTIT